MIEGFILKDGRLIFGDHSSAIILHPKGVSFLINGVEKTLDEIIMSIYNGKYVQPEESQWIQTDNTDEWVCSNCGHSECCFDLYPDELELNYCSKCGHKMSVNRIDFDDECLFEEIEDDECTENE